MGAGLKSGFSSVELNAESAALQVGFRIYHNCGNRRIHARQYARDRDSARKSGAS
jgi:hypothetical protein